MDEERKRPLNAKSSCPPGKIVLDVHIPNLGALRLDRTELSKVFEDGEEQEETPLQTEKYVRLELFDDIQGIK